MSIDSFWAYHKYLRINLCKRIYVAYLDERGKQIAQMDFGLLR
jgi:hypothetical protein